jgi:hypothetical protein
MIETKTVCVQISFEGVETDIETLTKRVEGFIADVMADDEHSLLRMGEDLDGGSVSYEVSAEADYLTHDVLEFDSEVGDFVKPKIAGQRDMVIIEKSLQGIVVKLKHVVPGCKPFDQMTPEEQDQPLKNEAWIAIERRTGGWRLDVAASSLDDVDLTQEIRDDGQIITSSS